MSEGYTQLILEVFSLHQQLLVLGDSLGAPHGLTSARWKVMGGIALSDHAPTVSQVARKMGLTRQAVQRVCNDLLELGMLKSIDNPKDRRASCWTLSEQGWQRYRAVMTSQQAWIERISHNLDAGALQECTKFLKQFSLSIEEDLNGYINQPI